MEQKGRSSSGPAAGYCLGRTWTRIKYFPLGLLLLLLSAAVGIAVCYDQEFETYKRVFGAVLAAGLFVTGVYTAFTALRDALFPAKSQLAASIRSQLPYPDEAPDVRELFAMVDGDLREHGRWFGPVGVGKEWVLGDSASAISRIRGIFTVDRIRVRSSGGRTQSSRILQLVLIDDRWQKAVTDFRDPQDLKAAADCLALLVPDARRGVNSQYQDFLSMDDAERDSFLREFKNRQSRRASEQAQRESLGNAVQDMVLTLPDGTVTSRVSAALVEEHLKKCLNGEEAVFFLTPSWPVESPGGRLMELECAALGGNQVRLLLKLTPERPGGPPERGFQRTADPRLAGEVLRAWLRRQVPDLSRWEPCRLRTPRPAAAQKEAPPPRLVLVSASGTAQGHEHFTREDVQAAADGLVDGSYQKVSLTLPGGYLWIQAEAGDKADGRCTVRATRPDPDQLRFFTTRCTHRQAAAWLTAYADGQFRPGGTGWKDYTKQVEKV